MTANETNKDHGYIGDSMDLAEKYKRKYDEEQKKQALEQAKLNIADKTNSQQLSSANWIMPVNGKITSDFGWRIDPVYKTKTYHNGWDISANIGTPVKAVADGKVYYAGANDPKGYGNYIVLEHSVNGKIITSEYGHLSRWIVTKGQKVNKGQIIGYSGNTGKSTGPHLHITIRNGAYKGIGINPSTYIKF